jgi:hypothetical protein
MRRLRGPLMRKPNYRFERAERDRAKKGRNDKMLGQRAEGKVPLPLARLACSTRFVADSPLEGGVSCELVSEMPNSLLAGKIQGISGIM